MSLIDRIAGVFKRSPGQGSALGTTAAGKTTSDEMGTPSLPSELTAQMSAERDRAGMVRVCSAAK